MAGLGKYGPIKGSTVRAAGGDGPHAFKPYLAVPEGGGDPLLRIASGYVNSYNVDGTFDDTDYAIGTAEKFWVQTNVDAEGVALDSLIGHGASIPDDTAEAGYQVLFEIDATGAVVAQHVFSSLRHRMCAGYHDFWGLGAPMVGTPL